MGEKQRGEIILIAITSNRVKNKVEQKKNFPRQNNRMKFIFNDC